MTAQSADILTAALAMPESDRLEIAQRLLASVPSPPGFREDDPNFVATLRARLEYRDDELIDHDEAMRRIRESVTKQQTESSAS